MSPVNIPAKPTLLPGLDCLQFDELSTLNSKTQTLLSKRLGLVTNPTGQTQDEKPALDVLRAQNLKVCALFSPEHGPQGDREGEIESSSLGALPVHSLYGKTRRPTPEMLDGLDALVFDLQDVGARFYTYSSTLFGCLEECAKAKIGLMVLDRPNPLGDGVEGPIITPEHFSFIGSVPIPVTHGMTLGELARWFVAQKNLEIELKIVPVQGWKRTQRWPQTGLKWRRPSPNLPDFTAASWYPGLCLLEFCDFAVGRGTDAPFQILAAPHLKSEKFVEKWRQISDIPASAEQITPAHAKFEGQICNAVRFGGEAPEKIVEFGLQVMATLAQTQNLNPDDWKKAGQLLGETGALELLWNGDFVSARQMSRADAKRWKMERQPFLLYSS